MFSTKNSLFRISAALGLVFTIAAVSFAKTHSDPAFSSIKIKNFGQMDERFYRGAQPGQEDYKDLATLGIKTIIDLRDDPTSYEKRDVEAQGMRYVNIPMSDTSYPKEEQISAFLKLIADPSTGKFFVHCAGGRHRTGVIGAVYRFNVNHWNYDQVYAEMQDYDFYTRFGHGDLKTYVEDYSKRMQTNAATASAAIASQTKQ
jgi:protein tyrosine/serine phosphatase